MSYNYLDRREEVFKEENQKLFLEFRDKVKYHLKESGAIRVDKISISGDSWTIMAFWDRLVELDELVELTNPKEVWGQYRIFHDGKKDNR